MLLIFFLLLQFLKCYSSVIESCFIFVVYCCDAVYCWVFIDFCPWLIVLCYHCLSIVNRSELFLIAVCLLCIAPNYFLSLSVHCESLWIVSYYCLSIVNCFWVVSSSCLRIVDTKATPPYPPQQPDTRRHQKQSTFEMRFGLWATPMEDKDANGFADRDELI